MKRPSPNLAGFDDAQKRLRQNFGRVCIFEQWMPDQFAASAGVAVDQEGNPFDPTLKPASGGVYASASATVSVVFQPLTAVRRDEVQADAMGERSRMNKDIIVDPDDYYASPVIQNAMYFTIDGHRWRVVNVQDDSMGSNMLRPDGGPTRFVMFGEDTQ